jgi:malonyl-CoA O-methyltransferase
MLSKARRKEEAEAVSFVIHNLHEPLPFKQGEFDLVVSGLVLEHLTDLNDFFIKIYRVLKPSRRAVVSAMHPAMLFA